MSAQQSNTFIIRLLIRNYKIKWHERTLIGYMLFILDNRIGSLKIWVLVNELDENKGEPL